jgi:hypothetical protein
MSRSAMLIGLVVVLAGIVLFSRFTRAVEFMGCFCGENHQVREACIRRVGYRQMNRRFF